MAAAFVRAMLAPLRIEGMDFNDARIALERLRDTSQFIDAQGKTGALRRCAKLLLAEAFDGETTQRRCSAGYLPACSTQRRLARLRNAHWFARAACARRAPCRPIRASWLLATQQRTD